LALLLKVCKLYTASSAGLKFQRVPERPAASQQPEHQRQRFANSPYAFHSSLMPLRQQKRPLQAVDPII
jgi:hypothetical protein